MAKVSIIIPTKNRPDLLKRILASVINQSYQDWKLFITNNLIGINFASLLQDLNMMANIIIKIKFNNENILYSSYTY